MKIKVKIHDEDNFIFIEPNVFKIIKEYAGGNEKIGYLFARKIKDINEYIISEYTEPHAKDISTPVYSEMSKKHEKIAKKFIKKHKRKFFSIGFWHTHPDSFGSKKSKTDIDHFCNTSSGEIKVFMISTTLTYNIYIYYNSTEIYNKEERWID